MNAWSVKTIYSAICSYAQRKPLAISPKVKRHILLFFIVGSVFLFPFARSANAMSTWRYSNAAVQWNYSSGNCGLLVKYCIKDTDGTYILLNGNPGSSGAYIDHSGWAGTDLDGVNQGSNPFNIDNTKSIYSLHVKVVCQSLGSILTLSAKFNNSSGLSSTDRTHFADGTSADPMVFGNSYAKDCPATMGEIELIIPNDGTNGNTISVSDAETGNLAVTLYTIGHTGSSNEPIDSVSFAFDQTNPNATGSIDTITVDTDKQQTSIDLSGDTAYTSATSKCTITLQENLSATDASSSVDVAQIFLDAEHPRTDTNVRGGGLYDGYGYDATSSAWLAKGIVVPFHKGKNYNYSLNTYCYERDSEGNITTTKDQTTGFTPTETQDSTNNPSSPTYTDCNGIVDCVVSNFKIAALEVFGYYGQINSAEFGKVKSLLSTKAPFAYVTPIFSLDFSAVTEGSNPTITIPIVLSSGADYSYTYTFPAWLTTFATTIKTATSVLIWLIFVTGIIKLNERLFK